MLLQAREQSTEKLRAKFPKRDTSKNMLASSVNLGTKHFTLFVKDREFARLFFFPPLDQLFGFVMRIQ